MEIGRDSLYWRGHAVVERLSSASSRLPTMREVRLFNLEFAGCGSHGCVNVASHWYRDLVSSKSSGRLLMLLTARMPF